MTLEGTPNRATLAHSAGSAYLCLVASIASRKRKFRHRPSLAPAHELEHQVLGGDIVDVPEAHDDLGRADVIPGAHQAKGSTLEHFAEAGLAGAHHHERAVEEEQPLDVAPVEMIAGQGEKAAVHRVHRIRQRMRRKIDEAGVARGLEPVQHVGLAGLQPEQRLRSPTSAATSTASLRAPARGGKLQRGSCARSGSPTMTPRVSRTPLQGRTSTDRSSSASISGSRTSANRSISL